MNNNIISIVDEMKTAHENAQDKYLEIFEGEEPVKVNDDFETFIEATKLAQNFDDAENVNAFLVLVLGEEAASKIMARKLKVNEIMPIIKGIMSVFTGTSLEEQEKRFR